jgi:hypothetical protein
MTKKDSTLRRVRRPPLALFLALNLADFCTTACIIMLGGVELMPVAAGFLDTAGIPGLFIHKLFVASGFCYLCRNFTQRWWNLLNGLFTGVVTWNTIQLCLFIYTVVYGIPV